MIDELRLNHPLNKILKIAGLSKSTYEYYHSKKHLNALYNRALKEDEILSIIKPTFIHHKSRLGSRRIKLALNDKLNGVNHKRLERVMSQNNLKAVQGNNGKYHSYKGDNGQAKTNLLLYTEIDTENYKTKLIRDFKASRPNEKWTTDVSEFKYNGGKLYLSPLYLNSDTSVVHFSFGLDALKSLINFVL